MRFLYLLLCFICLLTPARSQNIQTGKDSIAQLTPFDATELPSDQKLVAQMALWRDVLCTIAAREKRPLFFQVYLKENVPYLAASQPLGVRGMEALRLSTLEWRIWNQVRGVQVFRGDPEIDEPVGEETELVLKWLSSLSNNEIERLVRDSLSLNRLPADVIEALYRIIVINEWGGRDMATLLRDRRSEFSLHLRFYPYISAADENKRNFTRLNPVDLPLVKPLTEPLPPIVELPFLPLEPMKIEPGEKTVDFGAGEILSWPEIIERANLAFGKTYQAPPSKDSARFFVSGEISRSAWEAVLTFLQEVKPLPPAPEEADVERTPESHAFAKRALQASFPFLEKMSVDTAYLRRENSFLVAKRRAQQNNAKEQDPRDILYEWERVAGGEEALPLLDFANEKETTVTELIKKAPDASDISLGVTGADGAVTPLEPIRPGLTAELESAGFKPSDKVRLRLSLRLEVSAPGKHPSSLAGGIVDGKFVPSMDDNRASIFID